MSGETDTVVGWDKINENGMLTGQLVVMSKNK